jgi:hypothetical protein
MENNTNNIQKPISLVIEEAKNSIVYAINNAQLHPVLLEMIIKELYMEIQNQVKSTTQREKEEYERVLVEAMRVNEVSDVVADVEVEN